MSLYLNFLIKCIIFVNVLGIYDVFICVDGKGCVVDVIMGFRFFKFKYVLEVIGVFFLYGLIFGGIVLIVVGCGFSDNVLVILVNIGDVFCKVLLSRNMEIFCKIDVLFVIYNVDNIGFYFGK